MFCGETALVWELITIALLHNLSNICKYVEDVLKFVDNNVFADALRHTPFPRTWPIRFGIERLVRIL